MSAAPAQTVTPAQSWVSLKSLEWAVVVYLDGELGNALDLARAAVAKRVKADGRVVAEWVKSGSHLRASRQVEAGHNPTDGTPLYVTERACGLYLVAVTKPAPPEKWVRLTSASGPAAVEVCTVDKGKVVKVEQYHPEDYRPVAMGFAARALEEVGG